MAGKHPLIEQAKKMLMDKYNIDEPAAHKFINRTAMDNKVTMVVIAKRTIKHLGGDRSKRA